VQSEISRELRYLEGDYGGDIMLRNGVRSEIVRLMELNGMGEAVLKEDPGSDIA
jgi:hypothetical protein